MPGAAAGAFAGIVIANNIARATKGIAAAKSAWQAAEGGGISLSMEKVAGSFEAVTGTERPKLWGMVQGVEVEVRITTDFVHYAVTEVIAKPVSGVDAVMGLYPSPGGLLSNVRDWLRQDIKIGDEGFDAAFLITGKPSAAAQKYLLQGRAREYLATLLGPLAGFNYSKDRVQVMLTGIETDPEVLKTAIALAVEAGGWL